MDLLPCAPGRAAETKHTDAHVPFVLAQLASQLSSCDFGDSPSPLGPADLDAVPFRVPTPRHNKRLLHGGDDAEAARRAPRHAGLISRMRAGKRANATSKYRGVARDKGKWDAKLLGTKPGGVFIGAFHNEDAAGRAVSAAETLLAQGVAVEDIVKQLRPPPPPADRSCFSSRHQGVSCTRAHTRAGRQTDARTRAAGDKKGRKWDVKIRTGGKVVHFGLFEDEDEGGKAASFTRAQLGRGASVFSIRQGIKEGDHLVSAV